MAEEAKKTPEGEVTENPQAGAETAKGGEARTFTQAEVDQIIKDRLEREKRKATDAADAARKQAEAEAAAKNGEWQKLAEQRERELAQAKAEAKEATIRATAARMGMGDLDYAVFLVSRAGDGADAEAVLKEWQVKNPSGAVQGTSTGGGSASATPYGSASATNPDTSGGKMFTRSQLRDPVFFQANKQAILQAAKEGRIKED